MDMFNQNPGSAPPTGGGPSNGGRPQFSDLFILQSQMNQPQQAPQQTNAAFLMQQLQHGQAGTAGPAGAGANANAAPNAPQRTTSIGASGNDETSVPASAGAAGTAGSSAINDTLVYTLITEFVYGTNKEQALMELGKKREMYEDLALVLWNSFGVMSCLLSEIIAVYPLLSPPALDTTDSNRVCNALALLQCVASHPDTRGAFLHAHIPLFLYPFLNTNSNQKPFEYLRLTSLGVIGALVKNDSPEVIHFLLSTEIIPLCLKIMEMSSELNKTVAIFIVQKILMDEQGFLYICHTFERFEAVFKVLAVMVDQLAASQASSRLLRHIVKCYLRLCDYNEGRALLRQKIPQSLRDDTFTAALAEDPPAREALALLLGALQ